MATCRGICQGTRPEKLRYAHSVGDPVARYDALQVEFFAESLVKGDIAVDVDAHYGVYSIIMAALCGQNGLVVAFEPDPYAREVLEKMSISIQE
jgi:hypothetical protein